MEGFATWDNKTPGISLCMRFGRITIFRTTLAALGYPEYYRFLFNPENRKLAIQICGMLDDGAYRLPEIKEDETCDIKCKDLVRFVFLTCEWNRNLTYRIPGKHIPGKRLVDFNLADAIELNQWRLLEPDDIG